MDQDTDADWETIARKHPFFGVLANPRFGGASLAPEIEREFYQTGEQDVGFVIKTFQRVFGITRRSTHALDFGSGVGRLTLAMSRNAEKVTGVDISPTMRDVARRLAMRPNVEYRHDLPAGPFDWVNSCIVFQHIPPERGIGIFHDILSRTCPGCMLSVQFPFYRDRRFFEQTMQSIGEVSWDGHSIIPLHQPEYSKGAMLMFDYPWAAIFAALRNNRFGEMHLIPTNHGGVHGAWVFSVRPMA